MMQGKWPTMMQGKMANDDAGEIGQTMMQGKMAKQ